MRFPRLSTGLILLALFPIADVSADSGPLVFVDVYGGYTWSSDQDVKGRLSVAGDVNGRETLRDLDVGNGPAFGGRIGAWLKTHPSFGVAIDTTRFDTDIDRQTLTFSVASALVSGSVVGASTDIRQANTMVSFDLMIRRRGERFTPYIMGGPGMMFSNMDDGGFFAAGPVQDDKDISFGYKAGAGLSYKLSESMHLIAEYRYIHGGPHFNLERSVDTFFLTPTNEDVEIDVDVHMFSGGVSIRF